MRATAGNIAADSRFMKSPTVVSFRPASKRRTAFGVTPLSTIHIEHGNNTIPATISTRSLHRNLRLLLYNRHSRGLLLKESTVTDVAPPPPPPPTPAQTASTKASAFGSLCSPMPPSCPVTALPCPWRLSCWFRSRVSCVYVKTEVGWPCTA
jgi:hypothetical protein